jgi:hypothetical protein
MRGNPSADNTLAVGFPRSLLRTLICPQLLSSLSAKVCVCICYSVHSFHVHSNFYRLHSHLLCIKNSTKISRDWSQGLGKTMFVGSLTGYMCLPNFVNEFGLFGVVDKT